MSAVTSLRATFSLRILFLLCLIWTMPEGDARGRATSHNTTKTQQLGASGDTPQPGDYDGDGRNDFAVWRPSNSMWYVLKTSEAVITTKLLGSGSDVPVSSPVSLP